MFYAHVSCFTYFFECMPLHVVPLFVGISAGPILILIAPIERRMFNAPEKVSCVPAATQVRAIGRMSRFEARADVGALMHMFANECHGLGPESRRTRMRSRHLSVSSMMEQDVRIKEEDHHETPTDDEWRKELNDKLEGIERALRSLSQSATTQ